MVRLAQVPREWRQVRSGGHTLWLLEPGGVFRTVLPQAPRLGMFLAMSEGDAEIGEHRERRPVPREERLAQQLRANLRRRKAQARAMRQETGRQETGRQETGRQETGRQETGRQEMGEIPDDDHPRDD